MAEYIDRDKVFNKADILTVHTREYGSIEVVPVEYLADLPIADVVPRSEYERLIIERDTYKSHSYNVQNLLTDINKKITEGYELSAAKACAEMEMWQRVALREKQLTERIDNLIKNYAECQKEVAEQIFEEIESLVAKYIDISIQTKSITSELNFEDMETDLAELKKKYIGE